jgi:hypothetical protein
MVITSGHSNGWVLTPTNNVNVSLGTATPLGFPQRTMNRTSFDLALIAFLASPGGSIVSELGRSTGIDLS